LVNTVAIIPAYNEQDSIADVILRTEKNVDLIVVVDDGSWDSSGEIAKRLGAVVLRNDRNLGYGGALIRGFEYAKNINADFIVTLDADSQHDGSEIPLLLNRLREENVDIVIGSRFIRGGSSKAPAWRKWGISFINNLSQTSSKISDSQSGFRAYTNKAINSLDLKEMGMGISTEILLKADLAGLKIAEVPIHVTYNGKTSTHNPVKHGLDVIISTLKTMSLNQPIKVYGLPGGLALVVSLFFWILTFSQYFKTGILWSNAALLAIGTTMVGLLLLCTAVILWAITNKNSEKNN